MAAAIVWLPPSGVESSSLDFVRSSLCGGFAFVIGSSGVFVGSIELGCVVFLPWTTAAAAAITRTAIIAIAATLFAGVLLVILVLACSFRLGIDQGLPIGDRDLVVIRMNFAESEKAMAITAILNECSLKGRFYTRHPRQIDIAFDLFLMFRFKVKFFNSIAANHDNPCFLLVGGVY